MDKEEIKKAINTLMKANGAMLNLPTYIMDELAENAEVYVVDAANDIEEIADYLKTMLEAQGK